MPVAAAPAATVVTAVPAVCAAAVIAAVVFAASAPDSMELVAAVAKEGLAAWAVERLEWWWSLVMARETVSTIRSESLVSHCNHFKHRPCVCMIL